MDKKLDFEEWFYSPNEGGFGLKAEYFYEDLKMNQEARADALMVSWLRYAFEAGRRAGIEEMK
jgi:hypothetical protein